MWAGLQVSQSRIAARVSCSMGNNYFHLVPAIVCENKYIDTSVQAIIRAAHSETYKPQITQGFFTTDQDGTEVSLQLTVNIGGSVDDWSGWSVALIMHSVRIDGIDHEPVYTDRHGQECEGWHRHVWDEKSQQADILKVPIGGFDACPSLENFLFRISKAMNITWNGADDADLFEFKK